MFKTLDSGNIITEFGHSWSACEYLLGYELLYENSDQTLPNKWTNALQNKCYPCIQWSRVLYPVVIKRESNTHFSPCNSRCNEL